MSFTGPSKKRVTLPHSGQNREIKINKSACSVVGNVKGLVTVKNRFYMVKSVSFSQLKYFYQKSKPKDSLSTLSNVSSKLFLKNWRRKD